MEKSKKTILSKILKITGITFVISLLAFIVLPIIFADTITEKVKVLANKNLFLWQFLKGGVGNQMIFSALFANQYIAPLLYLFIMGKSSEAYGAELFIMLGGVFATLGFLLIQANNLNKDVVEA